MKEEQCKRIFLKRGERELKKIKSMIFSKRACNYSSLIFLFTYNSFRTETALTRGDLT